MGVVGSSVVLMGRGKDWGQWWSRGSQAQKSKLHVTSSMVICLDIGILRKAFWRKASLNLIGKIKFQKPLLYKFSRKEIFFFTFFLIHQIQYLPLQMLNSSLGAHLLLGSL